MQCQVLLKKIAEALEYYPLYILDLTSMYDMSTLTKFVKPILRADHASVTLCGNFDLVCECLASSSCKALCYVGLTAY